MPACPFLRAGRRALFRCRPSENQAGLERPPGSGAQEGAKDHGRLGKAVPAPSYVEEANETLFSLCGGFFKPWRQAVGAQQFLRRYRRVT